METTTIPTVEYERLKAIEVAFENIRAKEAYDESREEESIPMEIVDRILEGEPPLRVWRKYRGYTLKQLATKIDISFTYLAEIETGKKDGSLRVWKNLAETLDVDLDDLVENSE